MRMRVVGRGLVLSLTGFLLALPRAAQGPAASPLLVSPRDLARELAGDRNLVLLQVGPKPDYDAGHIAGARFVSMQDLAAPRTETGPSLELPSADELRARLERLGISDDSRIVVIGGADWASPATRIIWTLQTAGLGRQTRFLNGGSEGWKRAGLPVTRDGAPAPAAGRLTLQADRSIVVDHAWVAKNAKAPGVRLIDARGAVFYDGPGMPEHNEPAGYIAGARNVPFTSVMNDSLEMLPVDALRGIFSRAGVQPGDTVVAYCHIGQQATAVLFAARVLGNPIKLYDGSFTEWRSRKLPIETPKR